MAFAPDEAGDAKQRPRQPATRAAVRCRLCRARRNDGDPFERDAIARDCGSRSPAGTNDTVALRQYRGLEPRGTLRRGAGKTGLLGQRMVNQGDQPQSVPMRGDRRFETGKGEAVDDRRGAVGKSRKYRRFAPRRELDDRHAAAAAAQPFDNVTIIEITAGQLIELTRNNENQFGSSSGAS